MSGHANAAAADARLQSQHKPSKSNRGRFFANRPRAGERTFIKAEDAQPNEQLKKRNAAGPPVVRASVPIPRFRGRGGASAPPHARSTRETPPHLVAVQRTKRSINYHPSPLRNEPHVPRTISASGHVQQSGVGQDRKPSSTSHHPLPLRPEQELPSWTPLVEGDDSATSITERSQRPIQSTAERKTNGTNSLSSPYIQQAGRSSDVPAASHDTTEQHRAQPIFPPSHNPSPLPRRHVPFYSQRDAPPHLRVATSGAQQHDATSSPGAGPSRAISAQNVEGDAISAPASQQQPRHSLKQGSAPYPRFATKGLASTSEVLPSGVHKPVASNSSRTQLLEDSPPPTKRRRISPESIPPSPPFLHHPGPLTHDPSSANDLCPQPVPSLSLTQLDARHRESPAMALSATPVKRERSPTPTLNDVNIPHLVTQGCVRITPTPLECRSGRPGYQLARKEWTAREVKKLRERALQPTRVFIREDGMVIDWKSEVPVMSDTLLPPPSSGSDTVSVNAARIHDTKSPPAKKAKLPDPPDRAASSNVQNLVDSLPEDSAASTASAVSKPRLPRVKPRPIARPGQTSWRRLSSPPDPPSASPPSPAALPVLSFSPVLPVSTAPSDPTSPKPTTRSVPTSHSAASRNFPRCLSPTSQVPVVSQSLGQRKGSKRHELPPDAEIIDLTEDLDDAGANPRSLSSSPEPLRRSIASRRPSSSPPNETPLARLRRVDTPTSRDPFAIARAASSAASHAAVVDVDLTYQAEMNEKHAAAMHFLERYLSTFIVDRSDLASAYSHTATFSFQILRPPYASATAKPPSASRPPATHHHGRVDVIAALLDLPYDLSVRDDDPEAGERGSLKQAIDWDFCWAREAGDMLLLCTSIVPMPVGDEREEDWAPGAGGKGKGKGKERAADEPSNGEGSRFCACEQRFVLRSRDWDEEDRSTPGVWPFVAVAHHMLFRPLPR